MNTFKNELIYKSLKLDENISYNDFYNLLNKDIICYEIEELQKLIIENQNIKNLFIEYFLKNKYVLKGLVLDRIIHKSNQKKSKVYKNYLEAIYNRMFKYCFNTRDFDYILKTVPDIDYVFKEFLEMIFVSFKDIEKIYTEVLDNLNEESKFLDEKELNIILKEEFLFNLKILNNY